MTTRSRGLQEVKEIRMTKKKASKEDDKEEGIEGG